MAEIGSVLHRCARPLHARDLAGRRPPRAAATRHLVDDRLERGAHLLEREGPLLAALLAGHPSHQHGGIANRWPGRHGGRRRRRRRQRWEPAGAAPVGKGCRGRGRSGPARHGRGSSACEQRRLQHPRDARWWQTEGAPGAGVGRCSESTPPRRARRRHGAVRLRIDGASGSQP